MQDLKWSYILFLQVAERFISAIDKCEKSNPPMAFLISFKPDDIRKQAEASTKRHAEGYWLLYQFDSWAMRSNTNIKV